MNRTALRRIELNGIVIRRHRNTDVALRYKSRQDGVAVVRLDVPEVGVGLVLGDGRKAVNHLVWITLVYAVEGAVGQVVDRHGVRSWPKPGRIITS